MESWAQENQSESGKLDLFSPSLLVEVGQAFVAPRVPVTVVAPQRTRMSGESTARQSAATWSSIASCAGRSSGSSLWHWTYKSHLIGKQVILGHTTCPNELEPLILCFSELESIPHLS